MSSSPVAKRLRVETVEPTGDSNVEPDEDSVIALELMMMMGQHQHDANNEDEDDKRQQERDRKRRERQQRMLKMQHNATTMPIKKEEAVFAVKTEERNNESSEFSVVNNNDENEAPLEEDDDDFDMFSSSVSPVITKSITTTTTAAAATTKTDDFQDADGYYKAAIGETIELADRTFTVLGVVGKGVFSTVLKCSTTGDRTVACKFIRHNETMARAAENEVMFLRKLNHAHIVQLELPTTNQLLDHRGHVVMVFPYLPFNLRDVLQKFGKGVGLSLQACKSYFLQLLSALRHLEKHRIVHADIKPDNILVTEDFSTVQLCDFGSALQLGTADAAVPTPYLVSRFYRAPEVILGALPTPALDVWAVGTTVAEVFLGQVLFHGNSNNDMLHANMEVLGPFSAKTLRQHLVQVNKLGIPAHFVQMQQNYLFLQQTSQFVNDKHIVKEISLQGFPSKPLQQRLLKAKSAKDSRVEVQKFCALLLKVLCLEATRRISVADAMKNEFFTS